MNGMNMHWDIVAIVVSALVCVTIAGFHGDTTVLVTGALGSIAVQAVVQLMNLKRTSDVDKKVEVVSKKIEENTAMTAENAKQTEKIADKII